MAWGGGLTARRSLLARACKFVSETVHVCAHMHACVRALVFQGGGNTQMQVLIFDRIPATSTTHISLGVRVLLLHFGRGPSPNRPRDFQLKASCAALELFWKALGGLLEACWRPVDFGTPLRPDTIAHLQLQPPGA
jgi:hypothetical protein